MEGGSGDGTYFKLRKTKITWNAILAFNEEVTVVTDRSPPLDFHWVYSVIGLGLKSRAGALSHNKKTARKENQTEIM